MTTRPRIPIPIIDPAKEKVTAIFLKGLPAGPGGAVGQVVLTANDAVEWTKKGKKVILVREETNPEVILSFGVAQTPALVTVKYKIRSESGNPGTDVIKEWIKEII